jgi:DNA primase
MKLSEKRLKKIFGSESKLSHSGRWLYVKCPYCGHKEASVSMNKPNHPFICARKKKCGITTNIYGITKYLGIELGVATYKIPINRNLLSLEEEIKNIDLSIDTIQPPVLFKKVNQDDYLDSRKVNQNTYYKYSVGRTALKPNYIIFIIERDNNIVGYIARHTWSRKRIDEYNKDKEPWDRIKRYDNSKTDFSKMLFGYDEIIIGETKVVIIVEGVFDKIAVDNKLELDNQLEVKCVASFGGKISKEQAILLKNKGIITLIVMFDDDVLNKLKKIINPYYGIFDSIYVARLKNGKDPDDMTVKELTDTMMILTSLMNFHSGFITSSLK